MFFCSSAVHEQNYILELLISKLAPDLFLKAHFLLFVDVCVPLLYQCLDSAPSIQRFLSYALFIPDVNKPSEGNTFDHQKMACLCRVTEQFVLKQESSLNTVLGMSQMLGSIDATLQIEGETAACASK